MSKDAILDQVFPVRAKTVLALRASPSDEDIATFTALAAETKTVAASFGRAPVAKRWSAFASAIDITRLLMEWEHASLSASVDADRFLRAARLRVKQLRLEVKDDQGAERFIEALSAIDGEIEFSAIPDLREKLAAIAIPVAIYADPVPNVPTWVRENQESAKETLPELTVAFVEFKIDGTIAERVQSLRARENHDLDIAVRVSRWPEGATALVLSPVSIEPASTYDLPTFRFAPPSGEAPHFFQQRGRMILHAPQALKARPFEFIYTAEFEPVAAGRSVSIAGQRALRLDGSSPDRQSISGYPGIDKKLMSLRETLRLEPLVPESDLDDLLTVLVPLSNLMGQSVQDNAFPGVISEAVFQDRVREWLRKQPGIGVHLEEQPHAAGGRADLSFRGIRVELKCEPKKRLVPNDCKQYAGQPASYAVGTDRRVAVLCVLDCSPKTEVPFPMEDGLFVYPLDTGTSPVYIAVVLVQGNLAKPSSHS